MAVIFKIVFAMLALCAIAFAFPSDETKSGAKQELSLGAHAAVDKAHKLVQPAETKAHEQHAKETVIITEEAHSRHKRGCKTVTYKKGGRTITAQKC